jgi:hypothetical protein
MSSVVISGDTSGSITLAAPAVAGTNTLTLPANTGTVITTASGSQSIPKAALPTGSVLQVVQATYASQVSTSAGPVDTGLSASITPTSATSKILVLVVQNFYLYSGGNDKGVIFDLFRGATKILAGNNQSVYIQGTSADPELITNWCTNYLDSPATTSSTTYKIQMTISGSGGTIAANWSGNYSTLTLMEIAA